MAVAVQISQAHMVQMLEYAQNLGSFRLRSSFGGVVASDNRHQ